MIKSQQVPLYLTPAQLRTLDKQLTAHRLLYNTCLEKKIAAYKDSEKKLSCFDLINSEISLLKSSNENAKFCNNSSLQQTVRRLDKSYNAFFRRCKKGETPGFPRFKNKDRFCTIDYGNRSDGWQIKKGMLYVQHLGTIRMADFFDAKESHHFSITKRGGKVYANFAYEFEEPIRTFATASIGLDFGLQTFITTSEGEKFDSPKFHKVTLKQEAKLHRRLHRAEKGSKARAKAKRSLQTHKRKEANRRRNFNHQLSRKLVNNYKVIVTEDIKLENLVSDIRNINRTYRDVAWGQFTNFLRYKAENAGRVFIKVNPAFTTQECSACGNLVPKLLTDRWHECSCGHKEDRDINAAKNILRRGLASLASVERLVTKSS